MSTFTSRRYGRLQYICWSCHAPLFARSTFLKQWHGCCAAQPASPALPPCRLQVETADLLLSTLRYRVPALLASRRVRLVVVDSVGALFRTHLDDDLPRRAELLVELAAEMKRLSDSMDVAFVVVNQVTDTVDDPTAADAASAASVAAAPGAKRAALGLAWSHCVNTRILLSRTRPQMLPLSAPQREQHDLATAQLLPSMSTERRTLRLLLSPSVEQGSCEYVINSGGISDVGPAAAADGRTFAY